MQVDDRMRFCTGFVGMGTNTNFTAHGTCFCVFFTEEGFTFDYFISAQHLLWPGRRRDSQFPPDTPIVVRLNTVSGTSRVIDTPPNQWIYPDDWTVDVCAFRFDEMTHTASDELAVNSINLHTMTLDNSAFHSPEGVGLSLGDEVFICGAFVGRVGYRKNIPVVRIANISAMPEEPVDFASPKKPAYLIETRSLGGTSGSPVFLNLQPERTRRREHGYRIGITNPETQSSTTHVIFPYLLLGMIIFIHGGSYQQDFVSEADSNVHPREDAEFNAGIAVALPVTVIIDLLNSSAAKEARMKEIEKKRKQSGARPASAIRHIASDYGVTNHPANDVNPTHREDFNSLLDAAVKKPARED